jgi:hypothetical protein
VGSEHAIVSFLLPLAGHQHPPPLRSACFGGFSLFFFGPFTSEIKEKDQKQNNFRNRTDTLEFFFVSQTNAHTQFQVPHL